MNYYDILEISNDSDQNTVKKAYKRLALKFHPDKNNDESAKIKFQQISEAYETLSNLQSKNAYDYDGTKPDIFNNPSEIYDQIFRNLDPLLSEFFTSSLKDFTETLLDENKTFKDALNQINTEQMIDKGSDIFKSYLKKNINTDSNDSIYQLIIPIFDISNDNDNQIDVNIEFLRKYSHIKLVILNDQIKQEYVICVNKKYFNIYYNEKNYLFELNYNFPKELYQKEFDKSHLFIDYKVNIISYVVGFYFKYHITDKLFVESNVFLKKSNIICFENMGLYNYEKKKFGNLYITFIPTTDIKEEDSVKHNKLEKYSYDIFTSES